MAEFNNGINFLTQQFEYLRMIAKDMEEYREYLQEQQRYNLQGRDQIMKIQQKNISQFKFRQLFEDVHNIFAAEVSFKSTQINLVEKYKKDSDEDGGNFLFTDYEKLKRILILLIENSLKYQKAGTIEMEVNEENQNSLCIRIDSQNIINKSEIRAINEKGYSENGFGFAIVSELVKSIKPKFVINGLQILEDKINEKTNIVFRISKNLHEEYYNQTITNMSHIGTHQDVFIEQKEKDVSNASHQQNFYIDQLIKKNQTMLNDVSQNQIKNQSQQQLGSNLNSPGKKPKSFSDFQIQLREELIRFPVPTNFINNIGLKKFNKNQSDYNGSNTNIVERGGVGTNNFLTINPNTNPPHRQNSNPNQNSNNNQSNFPNYFNLNIEKNADKNFALFLIVSRDLSISTSLYQLLNQVCNNKKDQVKYASNKEIYKNLLQKFNFEFILIDQIDGLSIVESLRIINLSYRNKKQNQKIIFFDFNGDVHRNLEKDLPLIFQQYEQNFNDTKSDFKLQPPQMSYFNVNNSNRYGNPEQQGGFNNINHVNRLVVNEIQSQHDIDQHFRGQANENNSRHSSNHESQESISIPSEPQNMNKHPGYSPDKLSPRDNEGNSGRSMNRLPNDPDISQQSNFNLMSKSKANQNANNTANGINVKKSANFNTQNQRVAFLEDDIGNDIHKSKNEEQKVKKLVPQQFQLSQVPHPRVLAQESEHNSIRSSTNKMKTASLSPDEQKNSPINLPLPLRTQNTGKSLKKSQYVRTEQMNRSHDSQLPPQLYPQKQLELTFLMNNPQNDNLIGGKYNESIEVEQSLKFFYYSLQYPFGYTQIYEAFYHMNFINEFANLNFSTFNLNRPQIYH